MIFVNVALCIAAVGLSSHFYELGRKEKEKRVAAENEVRTLTSELQLLKEKNRDLAEQLREAKRIAEEFVREKEGLVMAAAKAPPEQELDVTQHASGERTPPGPRPHSRLSFADATNALRLERIALAASRAKESAGEMWRSVGAAFRSSVRPGQSELSSAPVETRRFPNVTKMFPAARFIHVAAEAKSVARKAFGALGSLLSSAVASSTAAASPEPPPPSEASQKLTATNEDLRKELAEVREEKRELEREIAERTGEIPGSVNVGRVRITTGRRFSGKVLVVNPKYNFVVIDIGKERGLEKGEVLIVHRGNKFVGKAQVIKIYEKMAAADLIMDWMQDEVQVNDGVKKF